MRSFAPKAICFWPIAAASFLADFATKRWAVERLGPAGTPHPLLGNTLRFTLTYNDGGALGIETGPTGLFFLIVVSCALVLGLGIFYGSLPKTATFRATALGLLMGGALGNLFDRVKAGCGVVDFIDIGAGPVRFWTFNLADSAIFVGAILLAWWFWREPNPSSGPASCTEEPPGTG